MKATSRRHTLAGLLAALLLATAACSDDPAATPKDEVDSVVYITGLGLTGRESYVHYAVEKGYFAEAGINVKIEAGQTGDYNVQQVHAGNAQFAVIDYTGGVIRAGEALAADGDHIWDHMRLVAPLATNTLVAYMAPTSSGVTKPSDLAGRTLGVATGSVTETILPAYTDLANIPRGSIKIQRMQGNLLASTLASGRVDAIGIFVPARPSVAAAARKPITVLPVSDLLGDLYGPALLTSTKLIEGDPDLVARFTAALLRGLRDSAANPDEAGRILNKHVPAVSAESAAAELRALAPYVETLDSKFDPARVAKGIAVMRGLDRVPSGVVPADVFADVQ